MKRRTKIILGALGAALILAGIGVALWVRHFHRYTPAEVVHDVRAGLAARNAPRQVETFLEVRYGPMTEPANRQRAFLDFFNVGHIEGLQILVHYMPAQDRQPNIHAMAQWVADYRRTMSPGEKQALASYVRSEAGRATIQQATAKYLSQDVRYRSETAPVIAELMTTLAAVQKP